MDYITAARLLSDSTGNNMFNQYIDLAQSVPFYSDSLYGLCFGEMDADVSDYVKFMRQNNLDKNKRVAELFAGSAFESKILRDKFPTNRYTAIDLFKKPEYPGIKYSPQDIFMGCKNLPIRRQHLVFIGGTNKSLCSVPDVKSLMQTFSFANDILLPGGYFIGSAFQDSHFPDERDYSCEYEAYKIKHNHVFKGCWLHWGMVTKRNAKDDTHGYYPLLIVGNKVIKNSLDIYAYYVSEDFEYFRSWSYATIRDVAAMRGFELVNYKDFDIGFMVFKKRGL